MNGYEIRRKIKQFDNNKLLEKYELHKDDDNVNMEWWFALIDELQERRLI